MLVSEQRCKQLKIWSFDSQMPGKAAHCLIAYLLFNRLVATRAIQRTFKQGVGA